MLERALLAVGDTTGRRRARESRLFSTRRRILLERLDIDGPVRQLPSWQRLESDIQMAVQVLQGSGVIDGQQS